MADHLDDDLRFALQVTGHTLKEGTVDPESPLGRLQALAVERGGVEHLLELVTRSC
jgi:hypothetical protein